MGWDRLLTLAYVALAVAIVASLTASIWTTLWCRRNRPLPTTVRVAVALSALGALPGLGFAVYAAVGCIRWAAGSAVEPVYDSPTTPIAVLWLFVGPFLLVTGWALNHSAGAPPGGGWVHASHAAVCLSGGLAALIAALFV
ncbi:MAG: hypothetical protein AAGF92_09715 [Myxococcota bacterium]